MWYLNSPLVKLTHFGQINFIHSTSSFRFQNINFEHAASFPGHIWPSIVYFVSGISPHHHGNIVWNINIGNIILKHFSVWFTSAKSARLHTMSNVNYFKCVWFVPYTEIKLFFCFLLVFSVYFKKKAVLLFGGW